MVADALEVGDDVRREDHGQAGLADGLHERVEELAPGQRVERGHRLVEQQQLRALGQRDGQRDLRALAAREPADRVIERQVEPLAGARARARRPSPG